MKHPVPGEFWEYIKNIEFVNNRPQESIIRKFQDWVISKVWQIIPWIFEDTSLLVDVATRNWVSIDSLMKIWIPQNPSVPKANIISWIWFDLEHMEIWSNPWIATIRITTSDKIFLKACNEAMWWKLKWDDAYDYIKGRCEFLVSQE